MPQIPGIGMKTGDTVIWLYSKKRSFVTGCRIQRIPGVVIRICRYRLRILVSIEGREKIVNEDPDNVFSTEIEASKWS